MEQYNKLSFEHAVCDIFLKKYLRAWIKLRIQISRAITPCMEFGVPDLQMMSINFNV